MATSRTRKARGEYPHKAQLYRARPVTVQAVLFDGSLTGAMYVLRFIKDHGGECLIVPEGLSIWTPEGVMDVSPGNYVIRGVLGEFYPCKPDVFAIKYDLQEGA